MTANRILSISHCQSHLKHLMLGILLITCFGCGGGGDDGPTETQQEQAFALLAGNWTLNSIALDGQNVNSDYSGFSLSFTNGGFTTTNAGALFNSIGTWQWADATAANIITLDDGKEVTIVELTTSSFTFTFTVNSTGGVANGINGLAGNYRISVNK